MKTKGNPDLRRKFRSRIFFMQIASVTCVVGAFYLMESNMSKLETKYFAHLTD